MEDAIKKEIIDIAKAEGLDAAEDVVFVLAKTIFAVTKTILPKVNPAVAAFVVPILALVEPKVYEYIDKIDGEDDEGR